MRSVFGLFKFRVQTPISRTVALYNQSLIWIIIISIFFVCCNMSICKFWKSNWLWFTLKIYVLKWSVKDISFCSRILPIRNPLQAGTFLCYGQRASYNLNVIVPRLLSLPAPGERRERIQEQVCFSPCPVPILTRFNCGSARVFADLLYANLKAGCRPVILAIL